jgi:glutathione synthase/RimK-type ligase-like ATP-grasp enzyme
VLVQSLVPPAGHDVRLLVAGGRVVGAEARIAAAGEWRTNISLGGSHRPTVPSPEACELAVAAAAALAADFIGVDLLPRGRGYVVLELNGAVDFETVYSLPGRDVFADVADALGLVERRRNVSLACVFGVAGPPRGPALQAVPFADRPEPALAARSGDDER